MSAPRGGIARALAFAAGLSLAAGAGSSCQFFFPTPIDQEVDPAPTAPPKAIRAIGAPFRAGEVFRANVYLDSILGGTGELRATRLCNAHGKNAVRIEMHAASSGLARMLKSADSKTESLVDVESGYPISGHGETTIGDEEAEIETLFSPATYGFRHIKTVGDKAPHMIVGDLALPIEQTPHDGESALGYFRNWRPPPGTTGYIFAVFGRYPWRADLTFIGPETIDTDHGPEKAVRIEGVAQKLIGASLKPSENTPKRPFTIWFSDDDRRVPLRILLETSIAKVTVELTSYEKEEVTADPSEACAPLFDEDKLARELAARKARRERRKKPTVLRTRPPGSAAPGASVVKPPAEPPPADESKPDDDDEKEEKDSVDKLLRTSPSN